MRITSIFFAGLLGLTSFSCAGQGNKETHAQEEPSPYAPGYHQYVASRSFFLRTTPRLSGTELAQIEEGTMINAVIIFHDNVWNYIKMEDGSEGYVFGLPVTPRRQGFYPITE